MYLISIWLAKLINRFITLFNLGAGHTWPGHIGLMLCPNFFDLAKKKLPKKIIIISGTNGKTTTSKLVTHILEKSDLKVLHNYTGANLLNGIASSILLHSSLDGSLNYDIAVFESDEFTLPKLLKHISPTVLVLLNLSRDQLDRHWEIDVVLDKWVDAVVNLDSVTKLVLDKEQKEFAKITAVFNGKTLYFDDNPSVLRFSNLHGSFNAKNSNAAVLGVSLIGISKEIAIQSLNDFEVAYGRGEVIKYKEKEFQLFLAKNPKSVNENLRMLLGSEIVYDALLFILYDKVPDGHDVSWIYDVDPEMLKKVCGDKKVFVSGTRAGDMAIRLNYAGVKVFGENVKYDLNGLVGKIATADLHKLVVLPNYSAMLEVRKVLTGKKIL